MQIQTVLESTNILCKELFELRNEYYQPDIDNQYYHYRQILYHTDDFVCHTDKRGRVLDWSDGLSDIMGIDKNIMLGKYIWNIYNYLPLKNDVRTAEMIKMRELFLSCILTKRNHYLQNSKILSNIKGEPNNEITNISISVIGNNAELLVKFIFKKIK